MPAVSSNTNVPDGDVYGQPCVVLTDHPWPDTSLEQAIFDAAGISLVIGPIEAGDVEDVERLIQEARPQAILTCWAPVSAKAINTPSKLAIVARMGVGLDNIAVPAATARGAWVSNVPDYCVGEVSDHAIGLMLAHFRRIIALDARTKASGWLPDSTGIERISDLTVGIVGYGRIGQATARKLSAFGCAILSCSLNHETDDEFSRAVPISEIQAKADVIILHAPFTAETENMIDSEFLSKCDRHPLIINVSRGGLVDNEALIAALEAGQVRGAALDVIAGEPSPPAALFERSDVIVTPHIAFASTASLEELRRRACEEVVRALRGEALHHPCNTPMQGVPLDGGVASDIWIAEGKQGPEVVKRALPKLKVAADWFSDPARSATEVAAIEAFRQVLGPDVVPEILWTKPDENLFAMRLIDSRLRNWKKDLLAGKVDPRTAFRAGELLGRAHCQSASNELIRRQFDDLTYFKELRIDPFFLKVADKVPALAREILEVVGDMDRRRSALVHGDFSPKNILADGPDVVILDFEVTHWGDPRFDVGFCLSHLLLKALRGTVQRQPLMASARAFLQAYRENGPDVLDHGLVNVTGCLMLARLEGSSPVEYLPREALPGIRAMAERMVRDTESLIDMYLDPDLELA